MIRFKNDVKFECIEHLLIYLYTEKNDTVGYWDGTRRATYYSLPLNIQCNSGRMRSFTDLIQLIEYYFNVTLSYEELAIIVCSIVLEDVDGNLGSFRLYECSNVNDITIGLRPTLYQEPYISSTYDEEDEEYEEGYTGDYRAVELEREFFGDIIDCHSDSLKGEHREENGTLFLIKDVHEKIVEKECIEI